MEWLEYHHSLLGIPHFFIYDNNSTDGVRKASCCRVAPLWRQHRLDTTLALASADGPHLELWIGVGVDCNCDGQ